MKRFALHLLSGVLVVTLAAPAVAQTGQRTHQFTDETGTYLVTDLGSGTSGGSLRDAGDILWTFSDADSIPETVALCPFGNSAWAGQYLNYERMQRFVIDGDGTPNLEVPAGPNSIVVVAAAKEADLGAFLDTDPTLVLKVYDSTGTMPLWTHPFPANFTGSSWRGTCISRDGSVLACYVYDAGAQVSELHFFDGPTGTPLNSWSYAGGTLTAVDLTDDGSLCFVTQSSNGRLIDVATATEIFTAPGSGAGNVHHKISGDGEVLGLGGFRFEVYVKSGDTYTRVLNFTAPTSWFGHGVAVSRDGLTVGAGSCDYGSGYLNTSTRIWDVPTVTLLGEYHTYGGGSYQDSVKRAAMSDDGSVLAIGTWGTQYNDHPEVMVFDRSANLIGSVDTRGSVFGLDLSGDGVYALSGSKAIHANVSGRGGDVTSYQVLDAGCPGDIDGDGDTDHSDLGELLAAWCTQAGDPNWNPNADLDGDGHVGHGDLGILLADWGCGVNP